MKSSYIMVHIKFAIASTGKKNKLKNIKVDVSNQTDVRLNGTCDDKIRIQKLHEQANI